MLGGLVNFPVTKESDMSDHKQRCDTHAHLNCTICKPKEEPSRNFAITHVLQFFKYEHLPEGPMRDASETCARMAEDMADLLPSNPETTVGLRKLMEAKDCFVRSAMIGKVR